jgi:hypothetical protein
MIVFGGKHGYLGNTRDICVHPPITRVDFTGQNGATRSESMRMKAACGARRPR